MIPRHLQWTDIVFVFCVALFGCKVSESNLIDKQDASGVIDFEKATEESIRLAVPIGTAVEEAKQTLEESGCKCTTDNKDGVSRLRCSQSHKQGV